MTINTLRPPNVEPLDSNKLATLNEYKKIRKRLRLDEMSLEDQIFTLVDEVDMLENERQLDKIHYAGSDKYHNKLIEMKNTISAQEAVICGLEDEVQKLRSERRALNEVVAKNAGLQIDNSE